MVFHKKLFQQFINPNIPKGTTAFTVPFGSIKTFAVKGIQTGLSLLGKLTKTAVTNPRTTAVTLATVPALVGLGSTPVGREFISTVFDPRKGFKRGQATPEFITEAVEKVKGGQSPFTLSEGLKTAGIIGGLTALGTGGLIVAKKVKDKFPRSGSEQLLITGAPSSTLIPLAPVKQEEEEEVPMEMVGLPMQMPEINIKNTLKPVINVTVKQTKSKKFINQQVLIR